MRITDDFKYQVFASDLANTEPELITFHYY